MAELARLSTHHTAQSVKMQETENPVPDGLK